MEVETNSQTPMKLRQSKLSRSLNLISSFWKGFSKRKIAVMGLIIIFLVLCIAILAPVIAPYDPVKDVDYSKINAAPSSEHYFGTDEYGRDIFSRVLYGARVSITLSFSTILISSIIGVFLGLVSGYFGGFIDSLIMRIVDGLMAFPPILFALALMAALGNNLQNIVIALSIVYTPLFARLIRGCVLSIKEKEYVDAILVMGGSNLRLLFKHILPNCLSPLLIQMTTYFAYAILAEAALSFLGLGIPQPNPS
ncbi:ABC transporter permease [Bacillus tianshenii]|nr:ABC transporter permease [Bacillus tianshenii]